MTVERHDFLVELGTEELPPTALRGLEQAFAAGVRTGLEKGGLTHGDPNQDPPPTLLVHDARARLRSASGEREVPLAAFFRSFFRLK